MKKLGVVCKQNDGRQHLSDFQIQEFVCSAYETKFREYWEMMLVKEFLIFNLFCLHFRKNR